jgi:hypothetical protein
MSKLISKSKPSVNQFEIGSKTYWYDSMFDGRGYESQTHYGTVIKVNPKTVDVKTKVGDVYRVDKERLNIFDINELF